MTFIAKKKIEGKTAENNEVRSLHDRYENILYVYQCDPNLIFIF